MKKILIIFLMFVSIIFASCTPNNINTPPGDDPSTNPEDNLKEYNVTIEINGSTSVIQIKENKLLPYITHPKRSGYEFLGWYKGDDLYDFNLPVKEDFTLSAKFRKTVIKVNYDFGYDCFETKEKLRESFYKDFYNFLLSKEAPQLETEHINNFDDFYAFMLTWQVHDNRSDLYHTGDAFKDYYLVSSPETSIYDQPDTHFIGWCFKNNKYVDLINHLIIFFSYWRIDEGYVSGSGDIHGDDFFADSWSSLVDTAKFFYFTSSTLNTKYPWFNSQRVKDTLDNIPGVGHLNLETESEYPITLPTNIKRNGYIFIGWVDDHNNPIKYATTSMTVHAVWEEESLLDKLTSEFIQDFNPISGRNIKGYQFDTGSINSSEFVQMTEDEKLLKKWFWLYEMLAKLSGDETLDPNQENYDWNANRKFYIANLCGLFTSSLHTDTHFEYNSMDFSNSDISNIAMATIKEHYQNM